MTPVLVLGGGYSGLATAHRLARHGIRSTILEARAVLGGHGGCCTVNGALVEQFYHHIKPEDRHLIDLIEAVGLKDDLLWKLTRMGFYVDGKIYPFSSPIDLLRFRPFTFVDKLRFALAVLSVEWTDGTPLENVSAEDWIVRKWGRNVYETMMKPMLINKFDTSPKTTSAAFLHGRIKAVAQSKSKTKGGERLGYLRGSLQVLAERLAKEVYRFADIRLRAPVERVEKSADGFKVWANGHEFRSRFLLNTLPLNLFDSISKNFSFENTVSYRAAICAIFSLRETITPLYWLNVIDEDVTFGLLVNHSALGGNKSNIIYCSNYVREDGPLFEKSDDAVLELYLRGLHKMFGNVTVMDRVLSRSRYATPIFDTDYRERIRDIDRCVPGMYFAGNVKVFPGSRTVSGVVRTGYEAADRIARDFALSNGDVPLDVEKVR